MIPAVLAILLGFTPDRAARSRAVTYTSTADTANSSGTTAVAAAGLQCTGLAPSTLYLVEVEAHQSAAVSTTGIQWRIGDLAASADGSGSVTLRCRGASSSAESVLVAPQLPGAIGYCSGGSSSTATTFPFTPFGGWALWQTDATPSDVGVWFRSEVDTSAVTVRARSRITCTPL